MKLELSVYEKLEKQGKLEFILLKTPDQILCNASNSMEMLGYRLMRFID